MTPYSASLGYLGIRRSLSSVARLVVQPYQHRRVPDRPLTQQIQFGTHVMAASPISDLPLGRGQKPRDAPDDEPLGRSPPYKIKWVFSKSMLNVVQCQCH
jgi:hypothetical protein